MATGERDSAEFRILLAQQANRTVRILLTTVLDQYRESIKGIAMTVQDITREVELNEAKSQFISNVSHELRTLCLTSKRISKPSKSTAKT
jgi:two-component system sensor histidine kinase NblS